MVAALSDDDTDEPHPRTASQAKEAIMRRILSAAIVTFIGAVPFDALVASGGNPLSSFTQSDSNGPGQGAATLIQRPVATYTENLADPLFPSDVLPTRSDYS